MFLHRFYSPCRVRGLRYIIQTHHTSSDVLLFLGTLYSVSADTRRLHSATFAQASLLTNLPRRRLPWGVGEGSDGAAMSRS